MEHAVLGVGVADYVSSHLSHMFEVCIKKQPANQQSSSTVTIPVKKIKSQREIVTNLLLRYSLFNPF